MHFKRAGSWPGQLVSNHHRPPSLSFAFPRSHLYAVRVRALLPPPALALGWPYLCVAGPIHNIQSTNKVCSVKWYLLAGGSCQSGALTYICAVTYTYSCRATGSVLILLAWDISSRSRVPLTSTHILYLGIYGLSLVCVIHYPSLHSVNSWVVVDLLATLCPVLCYITVYSCMYGSSMLNIIYYHSQSLFRAACVVGHL